MGGERGDGGSSPTDRRFRCGTGAAAADGKDLGLDLVGKDEALARLRVIQEPPKVVVTQPKGTLCRLDARFAVALQPDAVFAIVIDPNNRRVFKNVKEVKLWKVLEDDGSCAVIESVQVTRFNFWFFSGTISTHLHIIQDRKQHQMAYRLAKPGMMKTFSGSWKIDPLFASDLTQNDVATSLSSPLPTSHLRQLAVGSGDMVALLPTTSALNNSSLPMLPKEVFLFQPIGRLPPLTAERPHNIFTRMKIKHQPSKGDNTSVPHASNPVVGSWVTIHQEVCPSFCPWPIRMHVRSMTAGIIREMLGDLQREALRLAFSRTQGNQQQI